MAIAPPAAAPADLNDRRRGRPPLLAQSARSFQSIDRFLMPGASSSAATSASAMAEPELTAPVGHENVNPNANTSPCPNPNLKPNHNPNSDATPSSTAIPVPKKPSRGRPRKNPSPNANNPNSDLNLNRNRNRNSSPNPNSNSNPSHSPSPDAAHDLTAVPVPKKTSKGRPRKNPSPASTEAAISAIPSSNVGLAETAGKEDVKTPNKRVKRKCTMAKGPLDLETKDSLSKQFQSEVASLVKFYHEDGKIKLEMAGAVSNTARRAEIAILIEESSLPFSSLVADVLQRLRATAHAQGGSDPTLASLRSTVLSIGERMCFGIPNSDADVLEDDSNACLWCWEVRDIKLLPETHRSLITARRRKRRKIAERIAALSAMITALTMAHDEDKEQMLLLRAEETLLKTESEDSIRIAVSQWQQKKAAKEAEKEVMIKEKEALKEQHRLLRETEKEQKRLDKEEEKKKLQQEKEKERLEKEASKRSQKEAIRQEKELRRQQEEVEKELKRKEKEAADLKKQAAVQKQATIMDRFLQSKKDQADSVSSLQDDVETGHRASHDESIHEKVIHDMDQEMLHRCDRPIKDFFSSHVTAWKRSSLLSSTRKSKRWCQRRMPKLSPVNELRLQGGPSDGCLEGGADDIQAETVLPNAGLKRSRKEFEESELKADKLEPEWDDSGAMNFFDLGEQDGAVDPQKFSHFQNKRRKLLQFDKSHRPAYYGSFSKRSEVIRPRNPLKMDPNLDYENDSDEEWEEEDPGESLSDCDKDEEDEKGDADEDDEAADGFVVPDGYLSESEVAHVDDSESESDAENSSHDSSTKVTVHGTVQIEAEQSLLKFARQRKALEHLTDQALRCNRPYIICNFHPNNPYATVGKTDRLCLDALRVCPLTLEIPIEVPQDPQLQEKVDVDYLKSRKQKAKKLLPETALCEMVEILLSSTHGMKKLVDVLSTKFPTASRSQLRIKVREIADYVDNHWQVKKEIIEHLGLTPPCPQAASSPDPVTKSPAIQLKPITKFFSKRCLPPENAGFDDPSPKKSK